MRCLSQRTKSDGSVFPCGKCGPCLSRLRSDWSLRLEEELKDSSSAYFVTLTYSDNHVPFTDFGSPTVSKRDCQLFLKRLRKAVSAIDKTIRIRYYLVAEYGSKTLRPHYHAIIFNLPVLSNSGAQNLIIDSWHAGHVYVGSCTPASISYCTKYCINRHHTPIHGGDRTFSLMSRNPGIGSGFISRKHDYYMDDVRLYSVRPGGYKVSLPRFFSERLYTPTEREELKFDALKSQYKQIRKDELHYLSLNPSCNYIDYSSYQLDFEKELNRRIIDKSLRLDKL